MTRLIHRRPGRRLLAVLAAMTALTAAALATNAASAHPNAGTHPRPAMASTEKTASKPTVVFVHGAFADSSGWNDEISALHRQGYPVIAASNELRSLAGDSDYVRSILQTIDGPIVLVGHSYGGQVITNAARGVANVRALVYIAAFAPDTGESAAQLVNKLPGTQLTPDALEARPFPLPGGGSGTDLYITASAFHDAFAQDLPFRTTVQMQAEQRPISAAAFSDPSGDPAWKTIPCWYLVASNDHSIPPAAERLMAARAGCVTTSVRSSHVAMISHPKQTLATIEAAIHAVD